jgi:hypothetical protein
MTRGEELAGGGCGYTWIDRSGQARYLLRALGVYIRPGRPCFASLLGRRARAPEG